MKFPMIAATLLAVSTVAAPALADGRHMDRMRGHWQKFDSNEDGRIEKSELDARLAARFKEADLNGDGKISFEESEAAREKRRVERRKERFDRMDRDGDGVLSEVEVNRLAERMWIRADLDDDDVVTMREMHERRERMHRMWRDRYNGHRGHHGDMAMPRPGRE